jgi:hypothetical protein
MLRLDTYLTPLSSILPRKILIHKGFRVALRPMLASNARLSSRIANSGDDSKDNSCRLIRFWWFMVGRGPCLMTWSRRTSVA